MVASFCVRRLPTECGEGLESQTTGAGAWARTQTGTGVSTGTPPTAQAPTPAPGTSWALTHSQRWRKLDPSFKESPQIEIVNVRDFLLEHKEQLKFYMNLHSYGEMVLLPWGYTYEKPDNIDQLTEVSEIGLGNLTSCSTEPHLIQGGNTGC